jgi:hypothetical protein
MMWQYYANSFTDYVHGQYVFGMSRFRKHTKHKNTVRFIELYAVKYVRWLRSVDAYRARLAMEFSKECFLPEVLHPDSKWLEFIKSQG